MIRLFRPCRTPLVRLAADLTRVAHRRALAAAMRRAFVYGVADLGPIDPLRWIARPPPPEPGTYTYRYTLWADTSASEAVPPPA